MIDYLEYKGLTPPAVEYEEVNLDIPFEANDYLNFIDDTDTIIKKPIKSEKEKVVEAKEEITKDKPLANTPLKVTIPVIAPKATKKPLKNTKGKMLFDKAFDEAAAENPDIVKYRDLLTRIAGAESGFNAYIQNLQGAPAYGYFQFMEGTAKGKTWNNITKYAGTDIETFRNSPKLQILAAYKLLQNFKKNLTPEDWRLAKKYGITEDGLIAGAWTGGNGGVTAALQGEDRSDKHWSKDGKTGTTVMTRMREFS